MLNVKEEYQRRGNQAIANTMSGARRYANACRLMGVPMDRWSVGCWYGMLVMAQYDLDADPLLAESAHNELRYLMYQYHKAV